MGTTQIATSLGGALFGATRQAVLRTLFGHPDRRFYQRQLIRTLGLGSGAVQRELANLTGAGILTRTVEGRQTYFQANDHCPAFSELRDLIRKTFGVAAVLESALQPLSAHVRVAFLYGSIAKGQEKRGSDVDVIIVGDRISIDEVVAALAAAQVMLGREVNPSVYPTEEFRRKLARGQHFLSSVVAGPKIYLIGNEDELRRLAQIRVGERAQAQPPGDHRSLRRRGSRP